jgi:O-antigen/teichoic acid export membrane protein
MIEKALRVFSTSTVRQSIVTSFATALSGLLGILFYVLLGRFLGPEKFGVFSIVVITTTLLADIENVGTDTGIIKFVGNYKSKNPEKALRFIKLGFKVKLFVGLVIVFMGLLLSSKLAVLIGRPNIGDVLKYAFLGSLGVLLFSLTTSSIQAFEKYFVWGILNISLNLIRLVGIAGIFLLGRLSIENALQIYILLPFVGFIAGSFFLPNYFKVKKSSLVAKEFFHYNKWVALFILIAAFSARLDSYLSTRFLSPYDLGIYSAAVTIAGIGAQIVAGVATVVAPKLASMATLQQALSYLKKLQVFVLGLALLATVIALPIAIYLIPKLLGNSYVSSLSPFTLLFFAQLIFLISIPAHTAVIYYFSKPSLFVFISLIHLVIIAVLGWYLIPAYGYNGAAWAVLIGNVWNFLFPFAWCVYNFRNAKMLSSKA